MQQLAEMVIRNWAQVPVQQQLTNQQSAQLFLDYTRAQIRYRADPPNMELVKSAPISLCAPGAAACIPIGDCDDMTVAFLTLCGAFGIPIRILKQSFGNGEQEHVLGEIQTESGSWLAADPSVPDKPLGWKAHASHEDVIDPSDPSSIGLVGAPEAEFIGVGRIGAWHGRIRVARSVVQLVGHGLGSVGVAQAPAAPSYQLVTDRKIYSSNRYRVGMLVNFLGAGYSNVPAAVQRASLLMRLEPNWTVEQLSPSGDVTGGMQSWILQGVAKNDFMLVDDPFITYSVVAAEVPSGPAAPPVTSGGNVGAAKVAVVAGVLGLAAVWWGAQKPKRRRAA